MSADGESEVSRLGQRAAKRGWMLRIATKIKKIKV
jgi:hypothetical protein